MWSIVQWILFEDDMFLISCYCLYPPTQLAYLDTSEAGKATLNILNPDGDAAQNLRMVDTSQLEAIIAEGEEANKKLELEHSRHKTTPGVCNMYVYMDRTSGVHTRIYLQLLSLIPK